ncbi:malto-oligosyltrehalose trehalohydrolase [Nanchangia anserum]|uniref:Malto-oligosyltrehalose trehalohydrolase n=1 Tax=Nanchangia anserum TaxID=2692125 RepID=A0A8I0G6Q5_9ACTO|nr:malto-oligosyltrehalose trehalohydrolase [Nanchangia anserum]MBD3688815.1 malto-oligosyltrehalose trehalohydrolase [Nanchangia anserum]QOX81092.1 malto-oligosyltrehalose trehalohydrolase [Nanchangia anserum]
MREADSYSPGCDRVPVWAPHTTRVDLALGERRVAMESSGNGWWLAPEALADGTDYAFVLDGQGPFPDPRSRWQPHGVHGPSRTWTPPTAPTTCERDVLGHVIYELHVGTFTSEGTLDAAIARLDYLRDLGVATVELMPVAAFAGDAGWGYDGVGLYAVHHAYGGPEAYRRFVDAAHARGLAVCQDLVLNHLGPEGNYLAPFGPYFTSRHATPWGDGFNLDGPESAPVREYLIGAALRLVRDFGVDALRLDAVHAIADDSPTHLLAELANRIDEVRAQTGRTITVIAESDLNDYTMVTPTAEGGMGMDAQWDDDIHHALHVEFTGETQAYYEDFATPGALEKVYRDVFFHDGTYSSFRGRTWGRRVPATIDRRRFVAFASNHDQVGNRASGDRPQAHLSPARLAGEAALVILSPFTPMLFMGEEWACSTPFTFFTDFPDPALAQAVSEGRRREFADHGWDEGEDAPRVPDPQDPRTRAAAVLAWDERDEDAHARMERWYRRLIAIRADIGDADSELKRRDDLITLRRGPYTCYVSLTDVRLPLTDVERSHVIASFGQDPADSPTQLNAGATLITRAP